MDQHLPASTTTAERPLSRRGIERLDLMLLCTEALDFNGGEAMVWMSEHLGFSHLFPNRVELWKRRCHNPLRRACRRGELSPPETDALISILCQMADRLYPMLRSLLSATEQPDVSAQRWELFQSRLADLMKERMNPRRSGVPWCRPSPWGRAVAATSDCGPVLWMQWPDAMLLTPCCRVL